AGGEPGPGRPGGRVAGALGQGQDAQLGRVPLGGLLRPVADGGHDDLDSGEGLRGEGVQQTGEVVLRVRAVDDDAELGHRALLRLAVALRGTPFRVIRVIVASMRRMGCLVCAPRGSVGGPQAFAGFLLAPSPVNFSYSLSTSSVGPSMRSSPRSSHST